MSIPSAEQYPYALNQHKRTVKNNKNSIKIKEKSPPINGGGPRHAMLIINLFFKLLKFIIMLVSKKISFIITIDEVMV